MTSKSLAALFEDFGTEPIVFGIQSVFPVSGKPMLIALDKLKFDTNPVRFAEELDLLEKKNLADFAAKMTPLQATLRALQAENAELERRMVHHTGAPPLPNKRAR